MTIFEKKDKLQKKALKSWKDAKFNSLIAMCTGSGKTRVGILASQYALEHNPKARILIVCPTTKLRDVGWADEFRKWKAWKQYTTNVETVCYASLDKIKGEDYSLVIMDEAHNMTEPKMKFFKNNKVRSILALTATPPKDEDKIDIFKRLNISISFKYTLEEGVTDGVVAPFNITIIEMELDGKDKIYPSSKKSSYKMTEKQKYASYDHAIRGMLYSGQDPKFMYMHRMRFLYNLTSKTKHAKEILKKHFVGERSLIFSASIDQSEKLCKHTFHSKSKDDKLTDFKKKRINKLAAIKRLNEGENIPDLDSCLIVQLTSKDKDLIQRIGRIVRFRKDHEAKIWILVVKDTQDEKWAKNALFEFNPDRIDYISFKDL